MNNSKWIVNPLFYHARGSSLTFWSGSSMKRDMGGKEGLSWVRAGATSNLADTLSPQVELAMLGRHAHYFHSSLLNYGLPVQCGWTEKTRKTVRYRAFLCISHREQSAWVASVSTGYFALVCPILGISHGDYLTKHYLLRYILQKLSFIFDSAAFCNVTWELEK